MTTTFIEYKIPTIGTGYSLVTKDGVLVANLYVSLGEGQAPARFIKSEQNARRLAASWNACACIDVEILEIGEIGEHIKKLERRIKRLEAKVKRSDAMLQATRVQRDTYRRNIDKIAREAAKRQEIRSMYA